MAQHILCRRVILVAVSLLLMQSGQAAEVVLYPTWSAVGVELRGAVGLASAVIDWRRAGESGWRRGVEMAVDRKGMAHGSIWPLQQGDRIEVRVTTTARGRTDQFSATTVVPRLVTDASGRQLFVSAQSGNDSGTGSQSRPLQTLRRALKLARPGDTVILQNGVYHEGDLGEGVAGAPGHPIVVRSAKDQRAVLDSSTVIPKRAAWRNEGNGVFSRAVNFSGNYIYAAQDGRRMYRYFRLADLQQDSRQVRRAFFADTDAGRIHVRPGDASALGEHQYNVSRHDWGFYLHNSRHVVIRDLEIRNFGGACIRISGRASGNVIYRNELRNSGSGVFLKNDTTDLNAIWNNHIHEPGIGEFSWSAIKQSDVGRQGISATYAGRGTSICYNRIHDWFDGVVLLSWKKPDQVQLNRDSDVSFNDIWNIGDDAIELDGGGVNIRAHGNRIRNAHSAISLAPIERGPVYVTRNHAAFHTLMFKCSSGVPSTGRTLCYHNSGHAKCIQRRDDDPLQRRANRGLQSSVPQ